MPLTLVTPKAGRSPHYRVRGTYLGTYVDRSAKTSERKLAQKFLAKVKEEIERGAYAKPSDPIFSLAVAAYIDAGRSEAFLDPLLGYFQDKPLAQIGQRELDEAAVKLFPNATPATRNRQVYTPVIAVLRHAGVKQEFSRPKGSGGKPRTTFLTIEQVERLFNAASVIDREFASFIVFLCYTGCRLSEALNLQASDVNLKEGWAHVRDGKTGARMVFLPPTVVAAMAELPLDKRVRAFRFGKNGRLYQLLAKSAKAAKVIIPDRVAFHIFRHTYGYLMKKAGADLVGTGAWKSEKAASVYKHVQVTEEAKKAALLPVIRRAK